MRGETEREREERENCLEIGFWKHWLSLAAAKRVMNIWNLMIKIGTAA